MTSKDRLTRLAVPTGRTYRPRQAYAIGDGQTCPIEPRHGRMYLTREGRQYCASQAHDGGRGLPQTRSSWPAPTTS